MFYMKQDEGFHEATPLAKNFYMNGLVNRHKAS